VTYEEYRAKTTFDKLELLANANGTLIQGPRPEMGMLPFAHARGAPLEPEVCCHHAGRTATP
jgi:hypothetical protein